jgi:hypothetical protein
MTMVKPKACLDASMLVDLASWVYDWYKIQDIGYSRKLNILNTPLALCPNFAL